VDLEAEEMGTGWFHEGDLDYEATTKGQQEQEQEGARPPSKHRCFECAMDHLFRSCKCRFDHLEAFVSLPQEEADGKPAVRMTIMRIRARGRALMSTQIQPLIRWQPATFSASAPWTSSLAA
jgi:hypothetical protein